jgi:hypothetical protein
MEKKTEYQISSSVNEGILEIIITGEVKNDDYETIKNKTMAIQKSMNINNELLDVRTLKGRLGLSQTFFIIRNLHSDRLTMNTAFVDIDENASYNSIHETPSISAGLSFKCFTDIDAARAWLKSMPNKICGASL